MAQFTRVNGDFQQVMNYDAPAYTNEGSTSAIDSAVTPFHLIATLTVSVVVVYKGVPIDATIL